jgi:hypothetical protein
VQNEEIIKLINSEFTLHPRAQLIDYYKLFFQGTFGPGHIISDKNSVIEFLKNELDKSTIFEEKDYQKISYINDFYRVNLNVINEGMISFDDFVDAFLKSADIKNKIDYQSWLKEWKSIEKQIMMMNIPIENVQEQSAGLWKFIIDNKLVSHSDIYRSTYSPHYRLINSVQFKRINC